MENTSRDLPDCQRCRRGPGSEDSEQGVDDIFLPNQDGDSKVGEDGVSDLSGVRLVCPNESDKDSHVGRKCDPEKPPVDREEHITQVTNELGVSLISVLLIQITFPVESILLGATVIG